MFNGLLTGDQIPGDHTARLTKLISIGERLIKKTTIRNQLLRSKILVALGEAYKEKAMVTVVPTEYITYVLKAREYCETAIELLSSSTDVDSKYILGSAYRHAAVTYELEGDNCLDDQKRIELYQHWRKFSEYGANILKELNEYTTQAYALLNLASSYTRLSPYETRDLNKRKYLEESKQILNQIIPLFKKVEEFRGIGWAYIHLCETMRFLIPIVDHNKRNEYLYKFESFANRAVAELRKVDDQLAQGLAFKQLGIALYHVFKESDDDLLIKLEASILSIKEGITKLERVGYHRGTGEAFLWLAKSQYALWQESSKIDFLSSSVESLMRGILSTTLNIQLPNELDELSPLNVPFKNWSPVHQ